MHEILEAVSREQCFDCDLDSSVVKIFMYKKDPGISKEQPHTCIVDINTPVHIAFSFDGNYLVFSVSGNETDLGKKNRKSTAGPNAFKLMMAAANSNVIYTYDTKIITSRQEWSGVEFTIDIII